MPDAAINLNMGLPVVCITCYGRSGSVLLHGLLDNHPQVIAAPSHALVNLLAFVSQVNCANITNVVESVMASFPALFAETDQTPYLRAAAVVKIGVPKAAFRQNLTLILTGFAQSMGMTGTTPGAILRAIHYAYHAALGRDLNKVKIIVWQKHTPFADEREKLWLIQNVQNMKFLVPVRRPDVTLSAHYAAKNDPTFPAKNREPWVLIQQLTRAGSVYADLAPLSGAIRFEDMHAETEKVTRAMARFLDIDWDPCMLEPTVDGKELLFPKGTGVIRGFNPDVGKTQKAPHFNKFDQIFFEAINSAAYRHWGYKATASSGMARALILLAAKFVPMRMTVTEFKQDIATVFEALKVAFKRIKDRRTATRQALQELRDLNEGKTQTKLLDLLY
jgi:hypothetical protein